MTTIINANGAATIRIDWDAQQEYRKGFTTFESFYAALDAHRKGFHGPHHPVLVGIDTPKQHAFTDFGVVDRQGRAIGCMVSTCTREVVVAEAQHSEHTGYTSDEPGTYFIWTGNATRAGKQYGAWQSEHWCKSEAERELQIAKYLKGARARGLKTAAGKVAA
jgi:hypothetical protein